MMLVGKAEISRLNSAMDDTGNIIQELRAEISRRKSLCNMHACIAEKEVETSEKHTEGSYDGSLFSKLGTKSKYKITSGPSLIEEGECGSRGLTDDQLPEVLEMDQLEAELEYELQKLPWCVTEYSGSEGKADVPEAEVVARECQSKDCWCSSLHQHNEVLPTELDKKLRQVLIEQQESQIIELEAKLQQAHSKLHEKVAELQALKSCVKHLSEFSLVSASDEETDNKEDTETRVETKEKPVF